MTNTPETSNSSTRKPSGYRPTSPGSTAGDRNLRLYTIYQITTHIIAWLPVFFLYFNQYVTLDQAVQLAAVYYISVVLLEVPSGYLSDRLGRRPILIAASLLSLTAYLLFIVADGFSGLIVAEIFLAASIAFQSGSDTAYHYDVLVAEGREAEYAEREARLKQIGLVTLAISCLIGGALGSVNLVWPYYLSAVAAVATVYLACQFSEKSSTGNSALPASHSRRPWQVPEWLKGYANDAVLRWLLAFYVIGYSLEHVPFEFYQPYLSLLESRGDFEVAAMLDAPLLSGVVIGLSMFGGALGARVGIRISTRFGLLPVLATGLLIQCLIIAGLSLMLSPLILALVVFRNFSMAMAHGPLMGAIAPRLDSRHRATWLSLQSLAGRLFFGSVLFGLSGVSGDSVTLDWDTLSLILTTCLIGGAVLACVLIVLRPTELRGKSEPT